MHPMYIDDTASYIKVDADNETDTNIISYLKELLYQLKDDLVYYINNKNILINEIVAGIQISMVLLPNAIVYSTIGGVHPMTGINATIILCMISTILGKHAPAISGTSSSVMVIQSILMDKNGPLHDQKEDKRLQAALLTIFISGIMHIIFGQCKQGKLLTILPHSTYIGFMNSLAIRLLISQLPTFKYCDTFPIQIDCNKTQWMKWDFQQLCIIYVILITMLLTILFPYIPYIGSRIPSPIFGLSCGQIYYYFVVKNIFNQQLDDIGKSYIIYESILYPSLPSIPISFSHLFIVIKYGIFLFSVCVIQTSIGIQAIHEVLHRKTYTDKLNREIIVQGVGNIICSLLNGSGGCITVTESLQNQQINARYRVSGIICSQSLLLFVKYCKELLAYIPISVLTGLVFTTAIRTFYWPIFIIFKYIRIIEIVTIIIVTIVSISTNIAIGVLFGLLITSLNTSLQVLDFLQISISIDKQYKLYVIKGPQFFSSCLVFINYFDPISDINNNIKYIYINLNDCTFYDHSATNAFYKVLQWYIEVNIPVIIQNISKNTYKLIKCDNRINLLSSIDSNTFITISSTQYKRQQIFKSFTNYNTTNERNYYNCYDINSSSIQNSSIVDTTKNSYNRPYTPTKQHTLSTNSWYQNDYGNTSIWYKPSEPATLSVSLPHIHSKEEYLSGVDDDTPNISNDILLFLKKREKGQHQEPYEKSSFCRDTTPSN